MNHNQERFAQITGNSQIEFTQAWEELERFANLEASQYFHDTVSIQGAVDDVMDCVGEWLIKIHGNPELLNKIKASWGYIKTMIKNRIKKLSKERAFNIATVNTTTQYRDPEGEIVEVEDEDIPASSYRAFTPIEKPIKARDSIIVLYAYGESKNEIVKDCEVSRRYVNMVIKGSAKEIEELKALKLGIGN